LNAIINLLAESTESNDATGQEGAEGRPAEEQKEEKTLEDEIKDSWDAESDHENEPKGNSYQIVENLPKNKTLPPYSKAAKHKQQKKKGKHQRLCVCCATSPFKHSTKF
jgi:hypothetical protein